MTPGGRQGSIAARELAYLAALARAAAGALIFVLPMFMTEEMWQLGAGLDRLRLVVFLALRLPLLTGLTWYAGFREEVDWGDALLDALATYAVGFAVSAASLAMLGALKADQLSLDSLGAVAIQAVPAAFGAALAQSQLGGADEGEDEQRRDASYWAELLLMVAGALFVAFNIAPTEEVLMLAHGLPPWGFPVLAAVSVTLMHGFVYGVGFSGQEVRPEHRGPLGEFVLHGRRLRARAASLHLRSLGPGPDRRPGGHGRAPDDCAPGLPGPDRGRGGAAGPLMARGDDDGGPRPAPGAPLLERLAGAAGALLLLGVCGALAWDALQGEGRPADFAFRVLAVAPAAGGRHLVRFEVENTGESTAEQVAVRGLLRADPPEQARLILDFLAVGERREGAFLFAADPAVLALELNVESFSAP